jgi:molecular chaperone DnaK (HSP70)
VTPALREPVLAIDFGYSKSAAYLVVPGDAARVVRDPAGDSSLWPSSVLAANGGLLVGGKAERGKLGADPGTYRNEFKRDLGSLTPFLLGGRPCLPQDLARAMIRAIASAATSQLSSAVGRSSTLGRTVLTMPASYQWHKPLRDLMITIAEDAGLGPVELFYEPVAAAWNVRAEIAGQGGRLVLVYDYGGGTFDAALVNVHPSADWPGQVLGVRSLLEGGKDIDADLERLLRDKLLRDESGKAWLASAAGERERFERRARAMAGWMKEQLTNVSSYEDQVFPNAPVLKVWREELEEVARPHVAKTIACCRQLLAEQGITAAELDAIVLVGGVSRMPLVTAMLTAEFSAQMPAGKPVPLKTDVDRDLAVAAGAAVWATEYEIPLLAAASPEASPLVGSVLRWDLDHGGRPGFAEARLMRWHVDTDPERHEEYQAGQPLARIRYANGTLWDLVADEAGRFSQALAEPPETAQAAENGYRITSRQWMASTERW